MCKVIRMIGVVILIEVQVGSRLMVKVDNFINRMVIRKVYLCLIMLFRWLNISVLKGCIRKLVVKVIRVKMKVVVLLMLVKNCLLIIVVRVLQRKKLYYLKIVFSEEVKIILCFFWGVVVGIVQEGVVVYLVIVVFLFFVGVFIVVCYFCFQC